MEARAADSDDVASGVGVVVGEAAVWCVETLGCTGPSSERGENARGSARRLTIPVRPAQSNARRATATTETIPVRNGRRGRYLPRGASLLRVSLDRVRAQIRPIAPRRIGSSKNCQDRAATTIVATTWNASSEKLALCCGPGAVS